METSQFICRANQLTGFYMTATMALNGLNKHFCLSVASALYSSYGNIITIGLCFQEFKFLETSKSLSKNPCLLETKTRLCKTIE